MLLIERELIRLILSTVGCVGDKVNRTANLTNEKNAVETDLVLTTEDGNVITVPVWSGRTSFDLRACLCQIKDEYTEYYLLYRMSDGPIIAIGHVYHDNGISLFKKYNDGRWLDVKLKDQLDIASEFVSLFDGGVKWSPNDEYLDLLEKAKEVIQL